MNNYFRYFIFFFALFIISIYVGYKSGLVGNSYGYLILGSLLFPILTFPLYRQKTQSVTASKFREYRNASLYSKVGFVVFAIVGFIYANSQNFCAQVTSSWCYDVVPLFAYSLYGSFIGLVVGAIFGAIFDLRSSKE